MSELPPPIEFTGDVKRDGQGDGRGSEASEKASSFFNFWLSQATSDESFMERLNSHKCSTVGRVSECLHNESLTTNITSLLEHFNLNSNQSKASIGRDGNKSQTVSREHRELGNLSYSQSRNLEKAFEHYTKAILFAPHVSFLQFPGSGIAEPCSKNELNVQEENAQEKCEKSDNLEAEQSKQLPPELALAYGNRSAILFHLKQYKACLQDIDSAFYAGYDRFGSTPTLYRRKIDCLLRLERLDDAEEMLDVFAGEIKNHEELQSRLITLKQEKEPQGVDSEEEDEMKMIFDPLKDPEKNPIEYLMAKHNYAYDDNLSQHRALSRKVQICDEKGGRRLRAVERIEAGEIVAAEEPYVSVLMRVYELYFCHYCHNRLSYRCASVPCVLCSNVLYCSMNCRHLSWEDYHQYECEYLRLLYINPVAHCALRLLYRVGLKRLYLATCFASKKFMEPELEAVPVNPWPEQVQDFGQDLDNEEFYLLYKLRTQLKNFDPTVLFEYSSLACLMIKVCERSGFLESSLRDMYGPEGFQELTKAERHGWELFIGASLLKLSCLIDINLVPIPYRYLTNLKDQSAVDTDAKNNEKDKDEEKTTKEKLNYVKVGIALYPAICTMNHSCSPVVESFFSLTSLNIVRALQPIELRQEVLISYRIPYYHYTNYDSRRSLIYNRYYFECHCDRCQMECAMIGPISTSNLKTYYPLACDVCSKLITTRSIIHGDDISHKKTEFICTGCYPVQVYELKTIVVNYHKVASILDMCKQRVRKAEQITDGGEEIWKNTGVDKQTKERALRTILVEIEECAKKLKEMLVWRQSVHLGDVYYDAAMKCAAMSSWPEVEKYYTMCLQIGETVYGEHSWEYIMQSIHLADVKFALFKARPLKGLASNCVEATDDAFDLMDELPMIPVDGQEGLEEYFHAKRTIFKQRVGDLKTKVLNN